MDSVFQKLIQDIERIPLECQKELVPSKIRFQSLSMTANSFEYEDITITKYPAQAVRIDFTCEFYDTYNGKSLITIAPWDRNKTSLTEPIPLPHYSGYFYVDTPLSNNQTSTILRLMPQPVKAGMPSVLQEIQTRILEFLIHKRTELFIMEKWGYNSSKSISEHMHEINNSKYPKFGDFKQRMQHVQSYRDYYRPYLPPWMLEWDLEKVTYQFETALFDHNKTMNPMNGILVW